MKKNKFAAIILASAISLSGTANADEPEREMHIGDKTDGKQIEVQLEYLSSHGFTARRDMRNYNVHVFQKGKDIHALSLHYGFTFTRVTASV